MSTAIPVCFLKPCPVRRTKLVYVYNRKTSYWPPVPVVAIDYRYKSRYTIIGRAHISTSTSCTPFRHVQTCVHVCSAPLSVCSQSALLNIRHKQALLVCISYRREFQQTCIELRINVMCTYKFLYIGIYISCCFNRHVHAKLYINNCMYTNTIYGMVWNPVPVWLRQIAAGWQQEKIPPLLSQCFEYSWSVCSGDNTNIPDACKSWYAALDISFKFRHHLIINRCHWHWRGSLHDSAFICCCQNSFRKLSRF